MTKHKFIIRDPDDLNLRFYENYDYDFLWKKVEALHWIIEHPDPYKHMLADEGIDSSHITDEYFQSLRAHIHFAEFQQFEAFLALTVAVFQPLPHWVYLTSYRTEEMKEKAEALIKSDANTFSNGTFIDFEEAIDQAMYLGFRSDNLEINKNWKVNIANLVWLMQRLAYKYLNSNEYNSYKHGLRIMTGPSYFSFKPTNNSGPGITFSSEDSIRYLEIEKPSNGPRQVREVFQHFNPNESLNHLDFMCTMLENVKNVRLARLKGQNHANLKTLANLDKLKLNELINRTRWSMVV